MLIKELISLLQALPQEEEIFLLDDQPNMSEKWAQEPTSIERVKITKDELYVSGRQKHDKEVWVIE